MIRFKSFFFAVLFWGILGGISSSYGTSQAAPLLGISEKDLTLERGEAQFSASEMKIYCVGGLYYSDFYKPDGKNLTLMTPLKAFTVGPCSSDPLSPISLYIRFEKGIAVQIGYMFPFQNTFDGGWIGFLDDLILDDDLKSLELKVLDPSSLDLNSDSSVLGLRFEPPKSYANRWTRQMFFPLEQSTFVGVVWTLTSAPPAGRGVLPQVLLEQYERFLL
jgi:hypothetical protein